MARRREKQLRIQFTKRGGPRDGSGRPRIHKDDGAAHRRRRPLKGSRVPVHVTLRMREHVWGLRSRRSFRALERSIWAAQERFGSRIVHFSVQGNHIHLVVESIDERTLASAMKGLSVRIAKAMNRVMERSGPVLADRYHTHYLATPAEVRNTVRYVLQNHMKHFGESGVDRFSSLAHPHLVTPARTFLLRNLRVVVRQSVDP
jgi:REP element-mobilizing transposase RayT